MWRVHSANLTQVLRLDPRAVVVPLEHDHLQITMVDPALPLHDLQKIALTNRPSSPRTMRSSRRRKRGSAGRRCGHSSPSS